MNRFTPGNEVILLTSGAAYFPALIEAVDAATREVWLETYIFADDPAWHEDVLGTHNTTSRRGGGSRPLCSARHRAASPCACSSTAGARGTT